MLAEVSEVKYKIPFGRGGTASVRAETNSFMGSTTPYHRSPEHELVLLSFKFFCNSIVFGLVRLFRAVLTLFTTVLQLIHKNKHL